MKIGLLCSIVRKEEKLLIEELRSRGLEFQVLDDRELVFRLNAKHMDFDVVLERCVNHSRALYALKVLNDWGIATVNRFEVADVCGNKFLTTNALIREGVPSPKTLLAFTPESALQAIEHAKAAGWRVVAAVCLVDREEGGREAIEPHCPFYALFTARELVSAKK